MRLLAWLLVSSAPLMAQHQFETVQRAHLPVDVNNSSAAVMVDVDGDGDNDIVLASVQECRLLINDGTGRFALAPTPLPPAKWTTAMLSCDVDGDGDQDLFLGRRRGIAGETNLLFLNDGSGRFTDVSATMTPGLVEVTQSLAAGDTDGDGDIDIVIGNSRGNRLYLNNGSGTFTATNNRLPPGNDQTTAIAIGDSDGDGDLDIITGNNRKQNRLYLNDGTGQFSDATASRLPAATNRTADVEFEDFDGDGDLDLIFSTDSQPPAYLRNTNGAFTVVTSAIPTNAIIAIRVESADLDGDSDLDLVLGSTFGTNQLLLNSGSGTFTVANANQFGVDTDWTIAVVLADADQDGNVDILCANRGCDIGRTRLYLNDGKAKFTDATGGGFPATCDESYSVSAFADFDGDGDLDVIVGNEGLNALMINDGNGSFRSAPGALGTSRGTTYALAVGDVDADGDIDVVVGNVSDLDRLLLNDGTGKFTDVTATNMPASRDLTYGFAFLDADRDGDLDLACAVNNAQSRLYLNTGTGVFTDVTATRLPVHIAASYDVVSADFDADGDMDLVFGNYNQTCSLLVNNGSGVFVDATARMPQTTYLTQALATTDVDLDGDVDLVLANYNQSALYLNDGTGRFTDVTAVQMPAQTKAAYDVVATDFDGDGLPDLLAGTQLFLNTGGGFFADASSRIPTFPSLSSLSAGDVDDDQDADLLLVRSGVDHLYLNLLRQLSAPWVARTGTVYALDFYVERGFASSNSVIPVFGVPASTPIVLPPLGRLALDPTSLVSLLTVPVPAATGVARMSFPIPNNPTLVGVGVHVQAVVLHSQSPADWRLSNLWSERIIH